MILLDSRFMQSISFLTVVHQNGESETKCLPAGCEHNDYTLTSDTKSSIQ